MAKRIVKGAGAGLLLAAALVVALISSAGAAPAAKPAAGKPAADCQPFARTPCLLPFPNNLFTRHRSSSPTGLRVRAAGGAMPVNTSGQRISVAEYDRNDGFSPGSAMIVHVPGLDNAEGVRAHRRGRPPEHDAGVRQNTADRGDRRGAPASGS